VVEALGVWGVVEVVSEGDEERRAESKEAEEEVESVEEEIEIEDEEGAREERLILLNTGRDAEDVSRLGGSLARATGCIGATAAMSDAAGSEAAVSTWGGADGGA
jgi:ribosomal 30S subunit maturation factor RimM